MTKLKEYKMYINGSWVDAEDKKTFKPRKCHYVTFQYVDLDKDEYKFIKPLFSKTTNINKEGLYEIRDDIGNAEWTILTHQNTGKKMLTSLEGYNPQRFYFNPDRQMMPDTLIFSGESKTREPIISRGKHTIPIEHSYRYSDEINDWSYKLSIINEDFQE